MAVQDDPSPDGRFKGHLLHKRSLAEWRGLIAMIALKSAAHIDRLRVLAIDVQADNAELDRVPAFLRAATNLVPTSTIDPATSWHKLYVFLYGDKAIGMTSPVTLVVTATDYFSAINRDVVPWFNGKLLLDPTKRILDDTIGNAVNPVLSGDLIPDQQRELLAGWLKKLNDSIHGREIAPAAATLLGLIKNYVKDLGFEL